MPDSEQAQIFERIDITPWTGATPDDALAAGAREYSVAEAKALVQRFAEVSTSCNLDDFMSGFTEDCVVSFNEHAEMNKAQLRDFMAQRFAAFSRPHAQYLCRKALRSLSGNVFGLIWVNHWVDVDSRKPMRAKGFEFWTMRDSRIVRWDASIVAWPI